MTDTQTIELSATDHRRVDVIVTPWGEPSHMTREGYVETFAPDAYTADALIGVPVIDGHTGTAVGIVEDAISTDGGMLATLRLSAIDRAADLHTLAADGALGVSLGFDLPPDGGGYTVARDGSVTRTAVVPREVSLTPLPAYPGARVLATRKAPPMTTTPATPPVPVETAAAPTHTRDGEPYATRADIEALAARVDAAAFAAPTETASHPLAAYRSLGEYAQAVYRGDAPAHNLRAWVDQVPADSPGVMPPSWLTNVVGIIERNRALINGTGGPLSPGDSGLSLAWPYTDTDLTTLIGKQATPKTPVTSVEVPIKKGGADLETYAGGSDLALQLIERSEPSYLDAYMRIMAAAYATVTERAFAAALGTGTAITTTGSFYGDLIAAAVAVDDATGEAPSVIGIAPDVWASIAGAVDSDGRPVYAPVNPSNAPGTPTGALATGGLLIGGVPAYRAPGVPNGKAVVTNGAAVRWAEDGPRTITADHVSALGRDVAVYGYAVPVKFIPAGIAVITVTPPAAP